MYLELESGSHILFPHKGNGTFTTVTLIISSIGVGLSIGALFLLFLTAFVLREWRQSYKNQLLVQFMVARCTYTFVRYYFDLRTIFSVCGGNSCIIYLDEVAMIYTEIALVGWMFVFSRHMYESLVKVFNTKAPNIWKLSSFIWVLPLIIASMMYGLFQVQQERDLIIFFLYLAIIKWPLLISNAVILIMILKSLTKPKSDMTNPTNSRRLVITMNMLIFFFCFQQMFLDIYKIIYIVFNLPSYLLIIFNICTMYHCSLAVVFWVFGNANTRKLWKNKLCCIASKTPLSQTSSLKSTTNTVCKY